MGTHGTSTARKQGEVIGMVTGRMDDKKAIEAAILYYQSMLRTGHAWELESIPA